MKNLKQVLNVTRMLPELEKSEFAFFSGKSRTTEFIGHDEEIFFIKDGILWRTSLADGSTKSFILSSLFGNEVTPPVAVIFNELSEEYHSFHRSGEIYSFRINESDGTVSGQSGEPIEGGIAAVEWSPDEECGVIVNEKNEMFIVTSSCDVINYWDLQDEMEGEKKFINVGWGKKETQFQGSAGKAAAFSKPEQVSSDELSDLQSVSVTWRGDSSLFAVSFWCRSSSKRKVKIFNKDGALQCNGQDLNGLEEPLCWRPQGNLISMVQRLPNKYVVAFMEKDGLKHYDFTLPAGLKVLDLKWNHASQILCAICHNTSANNYELLFWTSKNYHWYLKQSFVYCAKPVALSWDLRRENRIKIALADGYVHILEFIWAVDHSGYSDSDDKSYAAVIDNKKLLVTQFSVAVVPPPMAMWTLEFDLRVNQVCYPLHKSCSSLAAICERGTVSLISKGADQELSVKNALTLNPGGNQVGDMFSWVWLSEHTFVCLEALCDGKCGLVVMEMSDSQLNIEKRVSLDSPIVSLLHSESGLLLGKPDGSYSKFNLSTMEASKESLGFPELCLDPVNFREQLIGLSENGRLYIGRVHVASNITSFLVAYPFIIATTSLHTLLVLKFTSDGFEETSRRKLENGSKLVLTTGTSVVLQLPRGNLETIQPRALTFLKIGSLLDVKQYGEAVQTLRRNRILLDVCIDHNPEAFLENVATFVERVDPHSLLILVSEMSPNDVTSSTYSSFYAQDKTALGDKINKMCSALLEQMNKSDRSVDFTLAKLSCLVKMKKMEDAFELADSDQALQHLLFLVPVEKLYAHALEVYNLPAALKIAGKSQMDPKEYVPYLNQLREMDANYMKFSIDKSLKKYSSALPHLANCGASREEECFAFISDNCLFKQGLTVFEPNSDNYKKCASMYGEHLFKKRCYEEAGCMYSRAGNAAKAIDSFVACCSWQRALSVAKAHQLSTVEIDQLGRNLQERLMAATLFKDAAQLCELHLQDYEEAVEAYTLGNCWEESLLVANLYRPDLIDGKIKPRIIDSANSYVMEINSKIEAVVKYAERLKIVRIEKANKPKFQDFDDMSETSSVSSRSGTSQGSKSSKMTRKASRKLWSLKEGNPREEEALLSALREIYLSAEKFPGEVKKVCSALVYLELDGLAQNLQQCAKDSLMRLQKLLPSIWTKDPNDEPTAAIDAMMRCAPEIHIPSSWELETLAKTG